ncbi:RNA polymerase III transcription factor IIIC subunit-domain-containing protein [Hysterangium stoloniferum]|nr:RNA polymerase III transcription factor IIIC subunit-domain-containing protein [Hysterangium stoloniferum]
MPQDCMQATFNPEPPKEAQAHTLPPQQFYSVEYPGYVAPGSVPIAIHNLGGQSCLDNAFRRIKRYEARDNRVDLKLQPENPFSHPVPGDVTSTNNMVLKVVKRKRKRLDAAESSSAEIIGEYTADIVGTISKTLRFRSLADFQYQPDMSDPLAQLRFSMDKLDAQAINDFTFSKEKEDYTVPDPRVLDPLLVHDTADASNNAVRSNLRLFPPPVFSRQGIPQMYNFKQNPMAIVETSANETTGQEKSRYINRFRWKGWSVTSISISEKEVPTQPSKQVEEMRLSANKRLYEALQKLFDERPIWTKLALINQFSHLDARELSNTKYLIPLVCYNFIDGPWRDALVKFGYDPRTDRTSRFYQRIYFRNVNNPTTRPSVTARAEAKYTDNISFRNDIVDVGSDRRSHIFDGVSCSSETASFQLLDIHDQMLKKMIDSEDQLRDKPNERDGWYQSQHMEGIKVVLRHKFFTLLEDRIATDEQCQTLLDSLPESRHAMHGPTYSRRARKHNKAKGAMPPEEEAAARLKKLLKNDELQL